jgi:16S rRNA (adenine1518-N6/adenine1519-N6)-dimethyltransferase
MKFPFAKKSLGQNFLTSTKALEEILLAAEVKEGDRVLEIGPGRGVLTRELLKKGAKVTAIEKDRVLVGILREMFAEDITAGMLEVIEADVLLWAPSNTLTSYKLIANIPYYITGQIFRMFLEGAKVQPSSMTFLVQKEVAERVVARDKKESILSMSVKAYGEPHYVATVKRGSFSPAPNVDSAILHIAHISKKFFTEHYISEKTFFEILKAAFAHKRKIISKNLSGKGFVLPDDTDPKARAEDLVIEDFAKIAKVNIK